MNKKEIKVAKDHIIDNLLHSGLSYRTAKEVAKETGILESTVSRILYAEEYAYCIDKKRIRNGKTKFRIGVKFKKSSKSKTKAKTKAKPKLDIIFKEKPKLESTSKIKNVKCSNCIFRNQGECWVNPPISNGTNTYRPKVEVNEFCSSFRDENFNSIDTFLINKLKRKVL